MSSEIGTCQSCKYWEQKPGMTGFCKRHAPTLLMLVTTNRYEQPLIRWPETDYLDGCGDYEQAKEE